MNGLEIRKAIDENNKIIQSLFTPNSFTLNNTIAQLLEENKKLQESVNMNLKTDIVFSAIKRAYNDKVIYYRNLSFM